MTQAWRSFSGTNDPEAEGGSTDAAAWLERLVLRYPAYLLSAYSPHSCGQRIHSRLADGRLLCWQPPASSGLTLAIDAELEAAPVPPALAKRCATTDPGVFWPWWTRAETQAKLHGIPILVWLRTHAWLAEEADERTVDRGSVVTTVRDGLVVSYGALS